MSGKLPGTPASELVDDVSKEEKTRRFLALERVQRKTQAKSLNDCLGKRKQVLVERVSNRGAGQLTGHSSCHKVVNFDGGKESLGKLVNVKITECKTNTLFGKIC